jgi:acetyltransferase-like isoleucine patch superfamily enzyme
VPVDRRHAFAGGPVYGRPSALAALARPRISHVWRSFERGAVLSDGCRLGPSAWCANEGARERISLGARVVCRGILRRETFGDGTIAIGDDVYVGDDCIVSCAARVEVGAGTLLGHGVQIFDNNSHPLGSKERAADWAAIRGEGGRAEIEAAPVSIGAYAWIGFGALVLKGVTIGDGAIVGAGSVVTGDVAPDSMVVGNPARPPA